MIWRRLAKGCRPAPVEPEHEYPPRFAQVLGSIALILALVAFALGATTLGWGLALAVAALQTLLAVDRLLPRLPAVLPALVGARPRHPDLDPRPAPGDHASPPGADPATADVAALRPDRRRAGGTARSPVTSPSPRRARCRRADA